MGNSIDNQKKGKNNNRFAIGLIVGLVCGVIVVLGGLVAVDVVNTLGCNSSNNEETEKKPVIYLYAAQTDKDHLDGQYTNIKLNLTDSKLTTTYPKYDEEKGWNVIAKEDGTIYSDDYSQTYNYLYWEADNTGNEYDLSKGFCVERDESSKFLEESLKDLGLNRKEANEFIVYWLPELEKSKYNLITFQTERYTETHKLEITPTPDNMLRVYMTVTPLTERKEIEPQDLSLIKGDFKREGFTVVEWGGTIIENINKLDEYSIAKSILTREQLQEVERIKSETSDWGGFGRVEDLESQKGTWKNIELDLMKGLMTEEQLQRLKEKSR